MENKGEHIDRGQERLQKTDDQAQQWMLKLAEIVRGEESIHNNRGHQAVGAVIKRREKEEHKIAEECG